MGNLVLIQPLLEYSSKPIDECLIEYWVFFSGASGRSFFLNDRTITQTLACIICYKRFPIWNTSNSFIISCQQQFLKITPKIFGDVGGGGLFSSARIRICWVTGNAKTTNTYKISLLSD
jgi:hypothetical protein